MSGSAGEILKDFNLIIAGDVSTTSDIDGSAIIGGNLNGSTFFTGGTPVPATPVIYLYGNQTGNLNIDNGGTLFINQNAQMGTVNLNGGAKIVTGPPPNSAAFYTSQLNGLSTQLSGLGTTAGAGVTAPPNNTTFTSGAGVNGVAVLNIDSSTLQADMSGTTINFNVTPGVTMIINVTGGGSFSENGNWNTIQPDVLFNFETNSSVSVTQFDASLLAPDAAVTNSSPINGTVFAASFGGNGEIHDFTFQGTLPPVCYVSGTRILTDSGERRVERLRPGDSVMAHLGQVTEGAPPIARTVKWVGHRHLDLTAHPRPELVAPIRIQASAFAAGVPHRDLLVSPDHAVLVDGTLILARQLINGATIRQERDRRSVDYFHVELDTHDILLAEGLPAESYLDTGNRGFFANARAPMDLHPDLMTETVVPARETMSCMPFASDEVRIKPVWQRLADRAAVLGQTVGEHDTTTDPGLVLEVGGQVLRPISDEGGMHIFILPRSVMPQGPGTVWLRSQASAPTDMCPWLEDRRRLGAYVERIALHSMQGDVVDLAIDRPDLSLGWWGVEREGKTLRRWTNGFAELPLTEDVFMVRVWIADSSMTYLVGSATERWRDSWAA